MTGTRWKVRVAVRATLLGLALIASSFSATEVRRAKPAEAGPSFEALPLERSRQNHLLVRAFINDKPALLGVDTGAPVSAIAINRRKYFGIEPIRGNSEIPRRLQINGAYNKVGMARTFRLGALGLVDEPLVAIDLSQSAQAARLLDEQAIDGILGADILFPTAAVLDCEKQLLIVKIDPDAKGPVPGVNRSGLRAIPMHVSKGWNLYVDGKINGKSARLMVDTGAFATLLHTPFVRRLNVPLRNTELTSGGVNLRERGVQMALIQRLSVGSLEFRRKQVGVINLEGLIHGGLLEGNPPVAGLLGSELLRRQHGIIDFGTRTLYLRH
jgi:predicted aspartyl protease